MPIKDIKHPQLKKIIKKATEKSQEKRYASAAEMIVDLERLLNRTSKGEKVEVGKDGGKSKGIIIAGITAVAAAVAAIVFWPKEPDLPPPPPPTASELYAEAMAKVASGQPDSLVIEGRRILHNLAKDSLYTEAIMSHYHHVLSNKDTLQWKEAYALVERLAVRDSLPEAMYQCAMVKSYHSEKQNLPEFEIYHFANEQDLLAAANWFDAVAEKEPDNYKARIYALMNYVQMKNPSAYGNVMRKHYANYLLITQNLPEEEKQVYSKTLEALRKRLSAWGLVNE